MVCPESPSRGACTTLCKNLVPDPELAGTLTPPSLHIPLPDPRSPSLLLLEEESSSSLGFWSLSPSPTLYTVSPSPAPLPSVLSWKELVFLCLSPNPSADSTSWECFWHSQVGHGPPSDSCVFGIQCVCLLCHPLNLGLSDEVLVPAVTLGQISVNTIRSRSTPMDFRSWSQTPQFSQLVVRGDNPCVPGWLRCEAWVESCKHRGQCVQGGPHPALPPQYSSHPHLYLRGVRTPLAPQYPATTFITVTGELINTSFRLMFPEVPLLISTSLSWGGGEA